MATTASIEPGAGTAWPRERLLKTRVELVDHFYVAFIYLIPLTLGQRLFAFRHASHLPVRVLTLAGIYLAALAIHLFRQRLGHRLRTHGLLLLLLSFWIQQVFAVGPMETGPIALAVMVPLAAGILLDHRAGWGYIGGISAVFILGAVLDARGLVPPFPGMEAWGGRRILDFWLALGFGLPAVDGIFLWILRRLFLAWSQLVDHLRAEVVERRQAEARLAESEARLRAAFTQSAVGFCRVDLQGNFLQVNRKFEEILGYRDDELRGRNYKEVTHADDLEPSIERGQALVAGQLPSYTLEKRYLRKSGEPVEAEVSVSLIRDADGQPESVFVVAEDISSRKRMQQDQARLQEQLLQAQKLESIGRLAGGVAHDINNMITAVLGHADLMAERGVDPLTREHLDGVRQAAIRSSGIVRQLLTLTRQQPGRPETMDLNARIQETRKVLDPLIGADVRIQLVPCADLWPVSIDPTHFDQVLMNLAVNARDAMPGGGRLTLETSNVQITADDCRHNTFAAPGPHALFAVSDEGSGMDRETLRRIFDPFFTTKAAGKGTGLGLSMVMGIVQQAGGFVDVYSEPGLGTTFKLYFPACRPEAPEEAAPEKIDVPGLGTGTILVVEDDPFLRAVILPMIQGRGYQVLVAETPTQALDLCRRRDLHLDLLLTDMVMPELGGGDLYEAVHALRPDLRVLFMSGYSEETLAQRGGIAADLPFLQKPFTSMSLAAKLAEVMACPQA
jgi:PAS domain S-box-containing protein